MRPEIEKGVETSGKSTGIKSQASRDIVILILKDDI